MAEDMPINDAPTDETEVAFFFGQKDNDDTFGLRKYLESQIAHAVGLGPSDKGKLFYVDANGNVARLTPGIATAIPYINALGLPAWSAAGVDNQVMQLTAGVPTWGGNPSAIVFLQTQTASANTSLDFTTGFGSTYDEYVFDLSGVYPSTAGSPILMRISEDGGSSFHATNYFGACQGFAIGATFGSSNGGSADTSHNLHGIAATVGPNNAATDGYAGAARLLLTNTRAGITSFGGWKSNNGTAANQQGVITAFTQRATTSRVNAVRFLAASGNINGKILMYGVKNV